MYLNTVGLDEMPGTVEDTVAEVIEAGGSAVGIGCDHGDTEQVRDLVDQIRAEHGRLDVLINNPWGGHEFFDDRAVGVPLWEQPLQQWDAMFNNGVRNQIVTLSEAIPLMLETPGRLIVAPTFWDRGSYLPGIMLYDLAKSTINRLAFAAATELRDHGIASVALSPGFMRTELVLAHLYTTEPAHAERPELSKSETPHYLGRAVASLADDPHAIELTGQVLVVADLARRYGFTDLDGTQPRAFSVAVAPQGPAANRDH